jgi:hypothetical protein
MRRALAQALFGPGFFAATLFALSMVAWPSPARAQGWTAPARELADKLRAEIPPPARLAWSVQNRSNLADDVVAAIRRAINSELGAAGYRPSAPRTAAAQVRINVSENFESYVWVAQIQRAPAEAEREIIILTVPRAPAAPPATESGMTISRKLLVAREEPILDLAALALPGQPTIGLLVLGSASLGLYEMSGTAWQLMETAPIAAVRVWPRDLRGGLVIHADGTFEASLAGERCTGSAAVLANLDCHASDDPWTLAESLKGNATAAFVADRNFLTGPLDLSDHTPMTLPDFYMAVELQNESKSAWLAATTGGRVELLGRRGEMASFPGWGSELAAVHSTCGSGTLVLTTRPTDFTEPDAVQAFQIRGRTARAASAPLEFTGPITRLHGSSEEGTAYAVARDLPTGLYEAFRLSIACGD